TVSPYSYTARTGPPAPISRPSRTSTHPTRGLAGEVYQPLRASSMARAMQSASLVAVIARSGIDQRHLTPVVAHRFGLQTVDFIPHGRHVVEFPVHGGIAHIADLTQLPQPDHDHLPT